MLKMTLKRVLIFLSVILLAGLGMRQCWQSKTDSEKWLYLFGDVAREYAGEVLGPGRGTHVPIPEQLQASEISVHENFVTFSPTQSPGLTLAFSPDGVPAADPSGYPWTSIGNAWYVLRGQSQTDQ